MTPAGKQLLESKLRDLPDNRLSCRALRHAWAVDEDFHLHQVAQERGGRRTPHIRRVLGCMRGCGVKVIEVYIQKRYGGVERISRTTDYSGAIGYQIPGVPRGVKPLHIIQQEQYRRSMEKVAKAARGDTATADGDKHARRAS